MKQHYRHLPLLLALLLYGSVRAQFDSDDVLNPSPEAAQLLLEANISPNYFNGLANVGLPLHRVRDGNLSVAIGLSYHGSGFRPHQRVGKTGMGWSLSAGGMISRTVRGLPDEALVYGLWNRRGTTVLTRDFLVPYFDDDEEVYAFFEQHSPVSGSYDLAPDIFSYNFNGFSGTIQLGSDGEYHASPHLAWKVRFGFIRAGDTEGFYVDRQKRDIQGGALQSVFGFNYMEIITEDGTTYRFGGHYSDKSLGTETTYADDIQYARHDSWHLIGMQSADGASSISFRYDDKVFGGDGGITDYRPQVQYTKHIKDATTSKYYTIEGIDSHRDHCYVALRFAPKVLKNIRASSGETVHFDHAYGWPKNNSDINCAVNYISKQLQLTKMRTESFDMVFEYSGMDTRMQLMGLQRIEGKGAGRKIATHRFTYYPPPDDIPYPTYLTQAIDHWGYFNASERPSLIPNPRNNFMSREPTQRLDVARMGALKRISFPTGAWKAFEYEQHDFSENMVLANTMAANKGHNRKAGGIRISRIIEHDPNTNATGSKRLFYTHNFGSEDTDRSSGILGGKVKQMYDKTYGYRKLNKNADIYEIFFMISSNIRTNTIYTQGSHINYSEVVEQYDDGSYTRYRYSDLKSHADQSAEKRYKGMGLPRLDRDGDWEQLQIILGRKFIDNYYSFSPRGDERGQLLALESYDTEGKPIMEKTFTYTRLDNSKRNWYILKRTIDNTKGFIIELHSDHRSPYVPTGESVVEYDKEGHRSQYSISMGYNAYGQLRSQLRSYREAPGDKGTLTLKTGTAYPLDYRPGSSAFIDALVRKNIVGLPIETVELVFEGAYWTGRERPAALKATLQTYYGANAAGQARLGKRKRYHSLRKLHPGPAPEGSFVGALTSRDYLPPARTFAYREATDYDLEQEVHAYDPKGHVQFYSSREGVPHVLLWGYDGMYPVMSLQNARLGEVRDALEAENTSIAGLLSSDSGAGHHRWAGKLRARLPHAMVSSFGYERYYGMTLQADPNGRALRYTLDGFSRLKTITEPRAGKPANLLQQYEYHFRNENPE